MFTKEELDLIKNYCEEHLDDIDALISELVDDDEIENLQYEAEVCKHIIKVCSDNL